MLRPRPTRTASYNSQLMLFTTLKQLWNHHRSCTSCTPLHTDLLQRRLTRCRPAPHVTTSTNITLRLATVLMECGMLWVHTTHDALQRTAFCTAWSALGSHDRAAKAAHSNTAAYLAVGRRNTNTTWRFEQQLQLIPHLEDLRAGRWHLIRQRYKLFCCENIFKFSAPHLLLVPVVQDTAGHNGTHLIAIQ
jgi:hypothetical protein